MKPVARIIFTSKLPVSGIAATYLTHIVELLQFSSGEDRASIYAGWFDDDLWRKTTSS
jgi:hypothetical protein